MITTKLRLELLGKSNHWPGYYYPKAQPG